MTLTERLSDLRGLSKSDVLAAIGLASKRSASERILSSLSIFGVGLLVGGAAALLLAPKTGTSGGRGKLQFLPRFHGVIDAGRDSHLNDRAPVMDWTLATHGIAFPGNQRG